MRIRALRPHRRHRLPSLAAVTAALVVQAVLAVLVLWRPEPAPIGAVPPRRAPEPAQTLTYIRVGRPREPRRPGTSMVRASQGEAAVPIDRAGGTPAPDTGAAPAGVAPDAVSPAAEPPHGLLDNPFVPYRDVRLVEPPLTRPDSLESLRDHLHRAFAEALARERAANGASDWTIGSGNERVGLTPGRLHLGRFSIPFPVTIRSLRDTDPRVRQQQSMIQEVREQAARREGEARPGRP